MNEAAFFGLGALVGVVLGWWLGARVGGRRIRQHLAGLLAALRSGQLTETGKGSARELPPVREIRELLSKGWIPRWMAREEALRESLKRLADYLRHRVEAPLLEGLEEGDEALRTGAEAALDAVEDLEFFLEDPPVVPVLETRNLVDLMGEVTQEFVGQFTIFLKVEGPQEPLRVQVDPEPLKDAIFLVLHNAGEFGGGKPVQMRLRREEDRVRILIRDQGPGFTPEALLQGLSPFYSTSPGGLGLGLPYARMALKAQGGDLFIRNCEEGGAEVEIVLPQRR
jgi:signal transduction histidine kinase